MTDVTQLLPGGGRPQSQRQVVAGYVSTNKPAPVDFSSALYVVLPQLDPSYNFGPCKWGAAQGSTLPAQGTEVLVCFDDENVPVVVWWEGSPGFAPTGAAGGDLAGSFPNPIIGAGKVGTSKTVADNLQSGSSLGTGSFDGQLAYYLADSTNGVIWTFRWRSAASANKWEFVGGSPLYAEILTSEATTTSTAYQDLTTVGPSITVPLAGDFAFDLSAQTSTAAVTGSAGIAALKIGAAATADNDGTVLQSPAAAVTVATGARRIVRNAAAAATVCKLQYRPTTANAVTFLRRNLAATPVRVT